MPTMAQGRWVGSLGSLVAGERDEAGRFPGVVGVGRTRSPRGHETAKIGSALLGGQTRR